MKFNPELGMYEARKFIAATNLELIGVGKTRDEAKADLKKQLEDYRKKPPCVVATSFRSPGFEVQEVNGIMQYRHNPDRKGHTFARPGLVEAVRKHEKEVRSVKREAKKAKRGK